MANEFNSGDAWRQGEDPQQVRPNSSQPSSLEVSIRELSLIPSARFWSAMKHGLFAYLCTWLVAFVLALATPALWIQSWANLFVLPGHLVVLGNFGRLLGSAGTSGITGSIAVGLPNWLLLATQITLVAVCSRRMPLVPKAFDRTALALITGFSVSIPLVILSWALPISGLGGDGVSSLLGGFASVLDLNLTTSKLFPWFIATVLSIVTAYCAMPRVSTEKFLQQRILVVRGFVVAGLSFLGTVYALSFVVVVVALVFTADGALADKTIAVAPLLAAFVSVLAAFGAIAIPTSGAASGVGTLFTGGSSGPGSASGTFMLPTLAGQNPWLWLTLLIPLIAALVSALVLARTIQLRSDVGVRLVVQSFVTMAAGGLVMLFFTLMTITVGASVVGVGGSQTVAISGTPLIVLVCGVWGIIVLGAAKYVIPQIAPAMSPAVTRIIDQALGLRARKSSRQSTPNVANGQPVAIPSHRTDQIFRPEQQGPIAYVAPAESLQRMSPQHGDSGHQVGASEDQRYIASPTDQTPSPEDRERAKRRLASGLIAVSTIVIFIAVIAIGFNLVNNLVFGPDRAASAYMDTLSSGTVRAAVQAESDDENESGQYVSDAIYAKATHRPTNIHFTQSGSDESDAVVHVSYNVGGQLQKATLTLTKAGKQFGVFDRWTVSADAFSSVTFATSELAAGKQLYLNGIPATKLPAANDESSDGTYDDTGDGNSATIALLPGEYTYEIPGGKYVNPIKGTLTVAQFGTAVDRDLSHSTGTAALPTAAVTYVKKLINQCSTSAATDGATASDDCQFLYSALNISDDGYQLKEEPTIQSDALDTTSGQMTVTLTGGKRHIFDPNATDWGSSADGSFDGDWGGETSVALYVTADAIVIENPGD